MHLSKIFLKPLFIFLTIFLFSTPAFAVGVQGGTLVATVSIRDAKITSQEGNTFNIAFSITNEEGTQSGVQYGVQLFSETSKGNFLVDEKIFDEKLDLPENSSFRKGISYTSPGMLGGTYYLQLLSKNSDGFPFAFYSLGKVTIIKTAKGVQISPDFCTIKTDKNSPASPLSKMAILGAGAPQSLEISCVVTNTDSAAVSATPIFKTNLRDSFGDVVEVSGSVMAPVSFKANEKKTVSLKVPLATKPQTYSTTLSFNIAGMVSNSVSLRYMVSGPSVTISNLSLDKDYYKRGETAALSLVWLSSAPKTFIETTLESKYGMKCAKTIEREITTSDNEILFPVTYACRDPHVSVSIKDDKGVVLDQKDFSIKTSSVEPENSKTLFIVVIVLAILAIAMFYIRKNKNGQNSSNIATNIIPIIILAGLGSLIPMQTAHAYTYTSGPGNSVVSTVDVLPTTYAPNADIYLSYLITNNYSTSLPITFKAINDIGLGAGNPSYVYIPQPTIFAPGQQTNGGALTYDNLTFDAPGSVGSYFLAFETGVEYGNPGGDSINWWINDQSGGRLQIKDPSTAIILDKLSAPTQSGTLTGLVGSHEIIGRWNSGSENTIKMRICNAFSNQVFYDGSINIVDTPSSWFTASMPSTESPYSVYVTAGNIEPPLCGGVSTIPVTASIGTYTPPGGDICSQPYQTYYINSQTGSDITPGAMVYYDENLQNPASGPAIRNSGGTIYYMSGNTVGNTTGDAC